MHYPVVWIVVKLKRTSGVLADATRPVGWSKQTAVLLGAILGTVLSWLGWYLSQDWSKMASNRFVCSALSLVQVKKKTWKLDRKEFTSKLVDLLDRVSREKFCWSNTQKMPSRKFSIVLLKPALPATAAWSIQEQWSEFKATQLKETQNGIEDKIWLKQNN